jgi:hypothetical protein
MLVDILAIQQERLYQWDAFYRLLQALPLGSNSSEAIERLQWYLKELLFPNSSAVDASHDLLHALSKFSQVKNPSDHQFWLQKTIALVQDTLQQEHEEYYNNGVVRPPKRTRYSVS